jgi:hypothetical protein
VRYFLGLANYYRKLLKKISKVTSPLSNIFGKEGQPFKWDETCENVFNELKKLLSSAGVLKYFEFDKKFGVHTDASDFAIGGVLMQDNHPIAYESCKLADSQLRWRTHEKELYAVVHGLKSWRHYIGRMKTKIFYGQHIAQIPRHEGPMGVKDTTCNATQTSCSSCPSCRSISRRCLCVMCLF